MSLNLGSKIGEGGCSEVFELEDRSKLIKLAKANTNHEAMRREFNHNRIAWECGLPVAEPFDVLEIDGRPGIVFERIYGETLMERFLKEAMNQAGSSEVRGDDIRLIARLLYQIHSNSNISQLPTQRDIIKYSIHCVDYLSLDEKEKVTSILDTLPSKEAFCHGDPNPGNILIQNDGHAVIIDWLNASLGNPEADLAEYIIMIKYAILPFDLPKRVSDYFDSIREPLIHIFMDEYTRLSGITYDEVTPWIIPVAARKLSADAISEDEKKLLIQEIRRSLN